MLNKEEILKRLTNLKTDLQNKYKVKELGLFGSYANGEPQEFSDIDILADFEDGADFFDFIGLSLFLEEEFECKVDVVSKNALREELKDKILKTVIFS
ncbi:MAG: nucleotidyltransferase family protein [Candidatus Lokiarchaeota archaeon]|nr:nucleotidyltransferase family protein [Candidatus Lokiarchaeota archaeon]